MPQFVALLRGINVGGKNPIRMAELKTCLERHGFERVQTYIQSGNVLFTSAEPSSAVVPRIEKILTATFDYRASVVLRTQTDLRAIVEQAPKGFGTQARLYWYELEHDRCPVAVDGHASLTVFTAVVCGVGRLDSLTMSKGSPTRADQAPGARRDRRGSQTDIDRARGNRSRCTR